MKSRQEQSPASRIAQLEKELAANAVNIKRKNRDLEIEESLERVRARTMAMQHSDELAETAYILFQQFRDLGENPDQATIGIINEAEGVIEYWVTIYGNQTNRVFKFPIDEPNVTRKIYDAWRAQEKSLVIDLGGRALYDFSKFRESMGGAGYNEAEQRRIINVAFFSKGLINVQSTVTRSAESLRLLERFANVFEGTYTRFLDLKKAEAQAREAQIELALERVRARAMAMRDSKELSGMVSTVFSELTKLDFALTRCAIVIADSGSGGRMIWMANSEPGQPPISFYRKSLDHPYPNAANEEWKKRTPKWVYHLKGAEKKGMDDYYANSEEVAHMPEEIRQAMGTPDNIILSHSFNNFGYLRADSLEPLSEANLDILYRFAKVFDLGYTRFTDIKQAEAQAREAQIELALERVRAKTMAMQHSDELLETSQVVFQQLRELGETADQISIAIVKEDEGIFDLFATIYGTRMVRVVHPKIDDHFIMGRVYKNWKAHKKSFVVELGGEELRRYNILRNQLGGGDYYNEAIGPDDRWVVSAACFSKGILSFSASTEPTKEAARLLERFAKVFDSTYTRFLDLQKAEAQARESQIQLALERIRARTMAMQKSDELAETVSLVFKQLLALGIRTEQIRTCGIVTFDDNDPVGEQWITETNGEIIPQSFMVPYNEAPAYKAIYKGWKDGEKFMVIHLEGKALKEHLGYLTKGTNVPTRDVVLPQQAKEIFNHVLFFSQGCLFIITKEALPGYHDVFKRFGAVFQQSYTRFLDLKKAEAQAREGQIQLAMERVRARTMAMQRSDELMEASHLLDSQVRALGIRTRGCAFNIYGENESTEWFGLETGPLVYKTPREEAFLLYYEAGQRGDSLYINEFAGDACKAHYEYLCTLPDVGDALKKMRENGQPFPAYQIDHVVYFKFGYLLFITFEPVPEAHDIFKRFAAVFEQTYTRFLDLQKAEEQARESQIEAALERVRSRSMGMQKSDELKEVIQIIYEQFVHLNISIEHTGFVVDYRPGDDWHFWIADHLGSPNKLTIPDFDSAWGNDFNRAKEKGIDFFATNLTFDEKNKFYRDLFDRAPGMPEEAKELIFSKPGFAGSTVLLENVALYIENFEGTPYTDDENSTLIRFGKVFQQTYTRFLDLQQAEAQTREAKIEAGLERVRAKAMAMHNSEHLAETIGVFYHELGLLSVTPRRCGLGLVDKETHITEISTMNTTEQGESIEVIGKLKMTGHPVLEGIYDNWLLQKEYHPVLMGNEIKEYYQLVRPQISYPDYPNDVAQYGYFFYFQDGGAFAWTDTELPEAELQIYRRFNSVLSLTYRRYKDIKEAEEQARESQIQLGLERVRAKAMAMQTSEELNELIGTVFGELTNLDFVLTRCLIMIFDPETNSSRWWMANSEAPSGPMNYLVQYHKNPAYAAYLKAWKARDLKWRYALKGKVKRDWDNFLFVETELSLLPDFVIAGMKAPGQVLLSASFNNFGCLTLVTLEPMSDEHSDIMLRFAKVFDMSYTRFNDLKQAEAQAKEAQIQLALERVRARTMAMQKSDELAETAMTLFQQFNDLGVKPERIFIGNMDENTRIIDFWGTEQGGNQMRPRFEANADATIGFSQIYKAWKAKKKTHTVIMKGQELADHVRYVQDVLHMPMQPGLVQRQRIMYSAFFSKGLLMIVTPEIQSNETLEILERFAGVFDGTYTRFLDLQKAEAQAKESQIQLALERVRSRTMAMHQSGELKEVIQMIYEQLQLLNFNVDVANFTINYRESDDFNLWLAVPDQQYPAKIHIPHFDHPIFNYFTEAKAKGLDFYAFSCTFEEKNKFFDHFFNNTSEVPKDRRDVVYRSPGYAQSTVLMKTISLAIANYAAIPYSETENLVLNRFAKVFEQTYTRFNDLKQAEDQAREAKIETALERVRAVAMSMMRSDELIGVCESVFTQLNELGFTNIRDAQIYIRYDEQREFMNYSFSDYHGAEVVKVGYDSHPRAKRLYDSIQNPGEAFVEHDILDEELKNWKAYLKNSLKQKLDKKLQKATELHYYLYSIGSGALGVSMFRSINDEDLNILKRFRNVFSLSYQRYADIARAEEQAREAKIEAALERVRSRTMAMFKSDELAGTSVEVFKQLIGLGIQPNRLFIGIINDDSGDIELWATNEDGTQISTKFTGNINRNHSVKKMYAGWKAHKRSITIDMQGKELKDYFSYLKDELKVPFKLGLSQKRRVQLIAYFSQGFIGMASPEPQPETTTNLLERFAGVFNLTYTRFRDLQKAEAQAKDAKIEASLERVRSKTMAMHNSQDVSETVAAMFDELVKLGVEATSRLGIVIIDDTSHMEVWTASSDASGKTSMRIGRLDMTIHPILQGLHAAWKNKETMFSYPLAGEDMKAYFRAINNSTDYPSQFNLDKLPEREVLNSFLFPEGAIFIFSLQPLATEITQIFKKFAGVFGQTYRRYLDLQKAETQAREAQIEASLERVRGKALAMYNSKDLSSTASLVFTELRKLGVNSKRCGVALLSKNSRHTQLYVATTTLDTDSLDLIGAIELSGHPSLEKQYESWLQHKDYFTVLKGEELKSYKELIYSMLPVPYDHTYHEEFGYYLAFSEGFLFSWAERPFSEIEINILNRFKSIIDLTFRRYIELQKSEANAREAVRQSSLDRVRAEIASMRTTGDLDRITPLIWNELTTLGVPFIRCGVFIMDEGIQVIHTYLSTPDGKAIAAFQIPFDSDNSNGVGKAAVQGWRQKQAVTVHWTEEQFRNFSHTLVEQGEVESEEKYLTAHAPTSLDLHFFPFLQGMLYAGNTDPLSGDDKDLVQSLADAFSTAYARYEDFNSLELAKQQVENTLSDLKSAQTKLVQSEKMASLGELTAGIAHEIQNPLNFVNNFSEVNQEMIEELEEELNAGNIEEALALAADIKQNEQKINHHGKRADGIVKGMLEHSRTGGGEKMPINMNTLADEFMRLSYHGLRAKDKAFNAEMVTSFDPDLPKINVVGQDMGRVILNLFNNAFYAVNQKKKTADPDYRPEVSVSTAAENGRVSITVKDNGIGIPDAIKEKIMQPFFTTKPTGEGTGLGLSLTYDMVVKGHGGMIHVNSKEGEGSEFIISLPIN